MSNDYLTRAQTLIEALPYIQKYNGKIVVIKYGGNAMISQELREAVMSDIILLSLWASMWWLSTGAARKSPPC